MQNNDKFTYKIPAPADTVDVNNAELDEVVAFANRNQKAFDHTEQTQAVNRFADLHQDEFDSEIRRLADAAYLEAISADTDAPVEQQAEPVAFEATVGADAQHAASWQELGASAAQGNALRASEEARYVEAAQQYAVSIDAGNEPEITQAPSTLEIGRMGNNIEKTRHHYLENAA